MTSETHEIRLVGRDTGLSQAFTKAGQSARTVDTELKKLTTDARNTGAAMTRAGHDAQTASKNAETSVRRWGDAGSHTGTVLAALAQASTAAAGESAASQARLDTAFENSGKHIDDYQDKINALTKQSIKLAFDDEDAQDSLAALVTATGDADKALRDVAVAEDLARAKNIDLASATQMVINAENGRYRSLQTLGIQLDANATSEEAIAAIQQKTAGAAEAYAKTGAATFERYQIGIANALETVGGFTAKYQGLILGLGATASAAGPAADAIKAIGAASKESALAGAALNLAMGPAGVVLAIGAAAGAIYLWTQRESDSEKQTKALAEATDNYTFSIQKNITALAEAGTYDIAKQTKEYLDVISQNGAESQARIDALTAGLDSQLLTMQNLNNTAEDNPWTRAVEAGVIDTYTASVLAANDANHDYNLTADEIRAAQATLSSGFEATTDQLTRLTSVVETVTAATGDPNVFGQQMAKDQLQILQDLGAGYIDVEDAIRQLQAMPTNEKYNKALRESKVAQDALTQSIYGGSLALAANKDLIEEGIRARQAATDAIEENLESQRANTVEVDNNTAALMKNADALGTVDFLTFSQSTATAAGGLGDLTSAAATAAGTINAELTQAISDLNTELTDTGADGLNRYMGMIVGYTNSIPEAINNAKQWADQLIKEKGTWSDLDNMLANHTITKDEYTAAQDAQISITKDYTRALAASEVIQAKQAPLIAAQSEAAANYVENLADMSAGEQLLALAYADSATSDRVNQIADMAAGYDDMTAAQKKAFEQTVIGAAQADPALAAVLQSLGLIQGDLSHPEDFKLGMSVGGQTEMDKLIDTIGDLTQVLADIFHVNIDHSEADAAGQSVVTLIAGLHIADGTNAAPDVSAPGLDVTLAEVANLATSLGNLDGRRADTWVVNHVVDEHSERNVGWTAASGGMVKPELQAAAGGRMMTTSIGLVGEHGPELASFPYGTTITPAAATRFRGAGLSGAGPTFSGPITIMANDPGEMAYRLRPYRRAGARQ